MKLSGFMCDRCGKHFDKNVIKNDKNHTLVGVALIDLKGILQRFELCDDCLSEVKKYLTDPRAHVGAYGEECKADREPLAQQSEEEDDD